MLMHKLKLVKYDLCETIAIHDDSKRTKMPRILEQIMHRNDTHK